MKAKEQLAIIMSRILEIQKHKEKQNMINLVQKIKKIFLKCLLQILLFYKIYFNQYLDLLSLKNKTILA